MYAIRSYYVISECHRSPFYRIRGKVSACKFRDLFLVDLSPYKPVEFRMQPIFPFVCGCEPSYNFV